MPFDAARYKLLSRRIFIVSSVKLIVFFILFIRIFFLQVINGKYYTLRSDNNRIRRLIIPARRGFIYDKNNIILASNGEYYRIVLQKTKKEKDIQTILKIVELLEINQEEKDKIMFDYEKSKEKEISIKNYLTRKEVILIEFNMPHLENIYIGSGFSRKYINGFAYSHILGYVSEPSKDKIQKEKYIHHPDIKIGISGLEKFYNETLTGEVGFKSIEVDSKGKKVRDLSTIDAKIGEQLKITIDNQIQEFAYNICKDKKVALALLDVQTGEVLSMLSTPSFDINEMSSQISQNTWRDLLLNEDKPLLNRVIQSSYPPGSVFKIVTALTALENGHDPQEKIRCTGEFILGGQTRHCWNTHGHGSLNLQDAIKHSCNIYFYTLATRYKPEQFKEIAHKLSLGLNIPSIFFENQNTGVIPDVEWKKKVYNQEWFKGDMVNAAIGQGFVLANCLQLATMMARISNGGISINPVLTTQAGEEFNSNLKTIGIKPENLQLVINGMYDVINSIGGTGYFLKSENKNFQFCGKTGTSQVVSKFLDVHSSSAYTIAKNKPHGIFAGFAPYINPKYSIAVMCENGGFGSSSAGILAKKIFNFISTL